MEILAYATELSVCQVTSFAENVPDAPLVFTARTEDEYSLVCPTALAPKDCLRREDGWRAMRIQGVLDFSLIGILSRIAAILADGKIPIFAVSTYNTDYILTKSVQFEQALALLRDAGYTVLRNHT